VGSVLIIDSNRNPTPLLVAQLRAQGFQVFVAHRGDDGMAQALKVKPDLIIMDSTMPDATGFQMCNRFRRTEGTRSIPIILMSGIAQFPNQQKFALERGATEYISKPVRIIELGEIVDRYIGPNQQKRRVIQLPSEHPIIDPYARPDPA
jgi:PleD family two-component response regulator